MLKKLKSTSGLTDDVGGIETMLLAKYIETNGEGMPPVLLEYCKKKMKDASAVKKAKKFIEAREYTQEYITKLIDKMGDKVTEEELRADKDIAKHKEYIEGLMREEENE